MSNTLSTTVPLQSTKTQKPLYAGFAIDVICIVGGAFGASVFLKAPHIHSESTSSL